MMIGVIGGNGVAATNRLCEMIERKLTAAGAFRDAHHPELLVWHATRAPSRSMFLEGRGPTWIPDYVEIAKTLRALGCAYGCMCCNTAHYAVGQIAEESGLEFLNLLELTAASVRALPECELFCSDGARKFDIYASAFAKCAPGTRLRYPTEARQRRVTETICAVKTAKRFSGEARDMLLRLVDEAECPVVLGCTDLRVALAVDENLPSRVAADSLECLADRIVTLSGAGWKERVG